MNGVEKVYDYLLNTFFNQEGTLSDEEYFIDSILMVAQNTEYLYKWAQDSQRRSHTIAYEALLEMLKNDLGEPVTSPQLKAAFKKLGVDFKEVLKPVVTEVEEWRKSLHESKEINESEEIKTEAKDTDYIIVKDTIEGPLYMDGKSTSFDKKKAKIYGSEEEAKEALHDYKENVVDPEANDFRIERLNEFKEELQEGIEIECNQEDLVEAVDVAKVIDQINELESNLEMLENDKEVDQSEVKKVKDKIYRLNKKLDETKMLEAIDNSKDETNLKEIRNVLQGSGIKTERTLDLMSKDILKDLKNNYADDCNIDGIFPTVVITDAFQKKVEQITGRKPELKIGEDKEIKESKFDKCQATLPLDNYHSMGIIVSDNGETVQYMYSNDDESVYESEIEYDEEGNPFFRDENGEVWNINDFMRTNFGETKVKRLYANKELKESSSDEIITITDGTNTTTWDFNDMDFGSGIGDYFYNGNETGAQIGFAWNEEKGQEYIDNLFLNVYVGNEEESDIEYKGSLTNKTPDEAYKVTLSTEDYQTFLDWVSKCDVEEFTYYNEEKIEENVINEGLTASEVLKRDLPVYLKTNEGYMELSIDEAPEKPEDYDEGYITGWNKGEDPAFDEVQELRYQEATKAYEEGDVYQFRQVVDDIIYTICYGDKELDETLKQLNANIVNIEDLMK